MGKPIRDRGIRWRETYGDKSSWLKDRFDEEIGPGSYFRWEGHDSTTGNDYYVVVSPGYSDKHGYHFFAGLRKMPAEHGASGRKFRTQREALSHAHETWRIPPPAEKPAKPYVTSDIANSPTVMEIHHDGGKSAMAHGMTKEAMSLGHSGKHGRWHPVLGPRVLHQTYDWALRAASIMGIGAALYSRKEWVGVDKYGQNPEKGDNRLTGDANVNLPFAPKVATCEDPDPAEFQRNVHDASPWSVNLLFQKKKGQYLVRAPYSNEDSADYRRITFGRVGSIRTTMTVGWQHVQDFQQRLAALRLAFPTHKLQELKAGQNLVLEVSHPVDRWDELQEALGDITTFKVANFDQRNLLWLYQAAKEGKAQMVQPDGTTRPLRAEQIRDVPVAEQFRISGSNLVYYDRAGMPLGVKLTTTMRRFGMEAEHEETKPQYFQYEFKKSFVDGLLRDRRVNGDPSRIREVLATMTLTPDMFVDYKTAAPRTSPIVTNVPDVDEFARPVADAISAPRRNIVPPYSLRATSVQHGNEQVKVVRMYDPRTKKEVLDRLPDYAEEHQEFDGARMISDHTSQFVRMPDGSFYELKQGEWRMYDTESRGKMVPGDFYRIMLAPKNANIMSTEAQAIVAKGQEREYFGTWSSLTHAERKFYPGKTPPPDDELAEVLRDGQGNVLGYYSVIGRQHLQKPLNPPVPKANAPVQRPVYEVTPDGVVQARDENGNPRFYEITADDVHVEGTGGTRQAYFRNSAVAMRFVKNLLAMSDEEVGPFTALTHHDLSVIDQKFRIAFRKFQELDAATPAEREGMLSRLEPWERDYYEWHSSARMGRIGPNSSADQIMSTIPQGVIQAMAAIGQDPENDFAAKAGTMYAVRNDGNQAIVANKYFVAQDKAEQFRQYLEEVHGDKFRRGLTVVAAEGQSLVQGKEPGEPISFNLDVIANLDEFAEAYDVEKIPGEEPAEGEGEPEPEPGEQPPGGGPEEPTPTEPEPAPAEPPEEEEPEVAPEPAPAPAPGLRLPGTIAPAAPAPPAPAREEPVIVLPGEPIPRAKPGLSIPKAPARTPTTKTPGEDDDLPPLVGNSIDRLVRLADALDEQGKHEEADAVDRVIAMARKRKPCQDR